ncbi:MAG TPA: pitrilysin family protein [Vicinamibacterales bacterium]|nr:pitrilysin family protein [Vicinamibacterales bacterium]
MRTRMLKTLVIALAVGAVAGARAQVPQAPPSSKAVILKGKAPVSDEVLRVKLPRPKEADLPNGLHLIVLEDRRVPRVTFQLLMPGAGGYYDPADLPGLAGVTAAVMREGTTTRSSQQLSEQLESIAATLSVSAGISTSEASVSGSCLTEDVGTLFELFADVLLNPSFPEDELARYRQRTKAGLIQQRSSAGFLGNEMFAKVLYGNHPAGRVSTTPEALDKVTRAALVEAHRTRYVPDHAVLAIAGDISQAEAQKLVASKLGAWKRAGTPAPAVAQPPDPESPRVYFVARPKSVQTNLVVGAPGIERLDPDYDALEVMNKILGGGPSGRLFMVLREEKSYTYGAYSGVSATRWRGTWQATTEVRTEVTEPALRDLLAQVTRMRDEEVPVKEFRDQQRSLVASFALSLENPQQMIGYYVTSWRFSLPADYWDKYPERVMAVTQAQVQAVARKYLNPSRLQIVAVGEPGKVGEILKGFGPVETYDTEGKRIPSSSE